MKPRRIDITMLNDIAAYRAKAVVMLALDVARLECIAKLFYREIVLTRGHRPSNGRPMSRGAQHRLRLQPQQADRRWRA